MKNSSKSDHFLANSYVRQLANGKSFFSFKFFGRNSNKTWKPFLVDCFLNPITFFHSKKTDFLYFLSFCRIVYDFIFIIKSCRCYWIRFSCLCFSTEARQIRLFLVSTFSALLFSSPRQRLSSLCLQIDECMVSIETIWLFSGGKSFMRHDEFIVMISFSVASVKCSLSIRRFRSSTISSSPCVVNK